MEVAYEDLVTPPGRLSSTPSGGSIIQNQKPLTSSRNLRSVKY